MNYAIRITNSYNELTQFVEQLVTCCDKLIIYEHRSNRIHIHGLLINCKVSTDTLKNYVKRALSVNTYPKTDWSFKTLYEGNPVDDKFIIYMSKGTIQPSYNRGFTDAEIEQYRSQWVDRPRKERSMTQYKLKYENPKEAKVRQNEMMEMIRQRCRQNQIKHPRKVLEVIRDVVYRECKTVTGRYKIRDYYDYVMSEIEPDKWLDNMEKIISYKDT